MRLLLAIFVFALPAKGSMQFLSASSQYGQEVSWTAVTNTPLTIFARFYPFAADTMAITVINAPTGSARYSLEMDGSSRIIARAADAGGTSSTAFGGTINLNDWNSAAAVFVTGTTRKVFLNGTGINTNSNTITTTGLDRVIVGSRILASAYGAYFNGLLFDVAIWNVELTPEEISALHSTRVSPRHIQTAALKGYWPMIRNGQNLMNGKVLSLINTPTLNLTNPPVTGGR